MEKLKLVHDFLLVKEVVLDKKIEGTNLNIKYDDNNHYLTAEIVDVSDHLPLEYAKYYPLLQDESLSSMSVFVNSMYKPGNKVILRRVAKIPYEDGLYFVSFKDVIAVLTENNTEPFIVKGQTSLFEADEYKVNM